jgi:hypothetical protein
LWLLYKRLICSHKSAISTCKWIPPDSASRRSLTWLPTHYKLNYSFSNSPSFLANTLLFQPRRSNGFYTKVSSCESRSFYLRIESRGSSASFDFDSQAPWDLGTVSASLVGGPLSSYIPSCSIATVTLFYLGAANTITIDTSNNSRALGNLIDGFERASLREVCMSWKCRPGHCNSQGRFPLITLNVST